MFGSEGGNESCLVFRCFACLVSRGLKFDPELGSDRCVCSISSVKIEETGNKILIDPLFDF